MLQKLKPLLPIVIIVMCVSLATTLVRYFAVVQNTGEASTASTETLFASVFPDPSNTMQAMKQWQGKIIIVNFWATWCPPCRDEMPALSHFFEQHRAQGVQLVGISTDDLEKVKSFVQDSPVSYPVLVGDAEAMTLSEQLGNDKDALPYTVIIDPAGKIITTFFGRIDEATLEQALQPLLAPQSAPIPPPKSE